jgi:hypothetical protein
MVAGGLFLLLLVVLMSTSGFLHVVRDGRLLLVGRGRGCLAGGVVAPVMAVLLLLLVMITGLRGAELARLLNVVFE